MKKVGKLVAAEQQLCYAHGVQLAVLDVLYSRRTSKAAVAEESESDCMMSLKDKLNVLETFAYSLRQWILAFPEFPEFPGFPGMTFFHSRFPGMKNHYRE